MVEQLFETDENPRLDMNPSLSVGPSFISVLFFDARRAIVEQLEARLAVPTAVSTDCDSGLLQHFVQGGFLNGRWRDALLIREELQLPAKNKKNKHQIVRFI